jgi:Protein of unknown function (DUF3015)
MKTSSKVLLAAALLAGLAVAGTPAYADDAKKDDKATGSGPNPWADCGIGAALFTETKWAAVTSNVIWDIGITAVISATASPQTCSGKKVAAANFINQTYANLAEETAVGQGEHLTTVLGIMECRPAQHAGAIAQVRREMAHYVADPAYADRSYVEKASAYYAMVDRAVAESCRT